jgi:hypothetical protein
MSNHEEEGRVKARHDVTQLYQRRSIKQTSSRQQLPRGDMSVSSDPSPDNSNSSSEDEVEDETYVPSPRAHPHDKGLSSASSSGAARDEEIEVEDDGNDGADGDDGEEEGEVFDVEEINPPNYVDMGPLVFRVSSNPTWRVKVSYKGKTESMRENRRILACTQPRDAYY